MEQDAVGSGFFIGVCAPLPKAGNSRLRSSDDDEILGPARDYGGLDLPRKLLNGQQHVPCFGT